MLRDDILELLTSLLDLAQKKNTTMRALQKEGLMFSQELRSGDDSTHHDRQAAMEELRETINVIDYDAGQLLDRLVYLSGTSREHIHELWDQSVELGTEYHKTIQDTEEVLGEMSTQWDRDMEYMEQEMKTTAKSIRELELTRRLKGQLED